MSEDTRIVRAPRNREHPYFMLRRNTAQDEIISYRALGLLTYLLSKPDNWEVRLTDLTRRGLGREALYKVLDNLKAAGYLEYVVPRNEGKFMGGHYVIHEIPRHRITVYQDTVLPDTVLPDTVLPDTVLPDTVFSTVQSIESLEIKDSLRSREEEVETDTTTTTGIHSESQIEIVVPSNAYALFSENLGTLTPFMASTIGDAIDEYSAGWVEDAIREGVKSARNGKPSWKYIEAILKRWKKDGRPTARGQKYQGLGMESTSTSLQTHDETELTLPDGDAFREMLLKDAADKARIAQEQLEAAERARVEHQAFLRAEKAARDEKQAAAKAAERERIGAMYQAMDKVAQEPPDSAALERIKLEVLQRQADEGNAFAIEKLRRMENSS